MSCRVMTYSVRRTLRGAALRQHRINLRRRERRVKLLVVIVRKYPRTDAFATAAARAGCPLVAWSGACRKSAIISI